MIYLTYCYDREASMGIGRVLKQFLLGLQHNKLRKTRHAPTVENNRLVELVGS